jgi:antitoxin VapB
LEKACRSSTLFPETIYIEMAMPINVNNPEADALTREFAQMAGVGITDAIVIAMREAIERRSRMETPLETAARLREKHGVTVNDQARKPLPREAFDAMWGENGCSSMPAQSSRFCRTSPKRHASLKQLRRLRACSPHRSPFSRRSPDSTAMALRLAVPRFASGPAG